MASDPVKIINPWAPVVQAEQGHLVSEAQVITCVASYANWTVDDKNNVVADGASYC